MDGFILPTRAALESCVCQARATWNQRLGYRSRTQTRKCSRLLPSESAPIPLFCSTVEVTVRGSITRTIFISTSVTEFSQPIEGHLRGAIGRPIETGAERFR